jgi:hypothetical protein
MMSASTATIPVGERAESGWLRSQRWDLTWVTLSVLLVAAPYLIYLGILSLENLLQPVAAFFGASVDSLARNSVNTAIALLVGGPHMYATSTRTFLDRDFGKAHRRMLWSALIIPVIVVTLAFLNLSLLLTVFFFWASIHVLHQIVYIVEMYNQKRRMNLSRFSRYADYAVVLTALYPLAMYKIAHGTFFIGPNDLGSVVGKFFPIGDWMFYLAGGIFALALVAWIAKTVYEARHGALHVPKTAFIAATFTASFFIPALGNLDTAFQGMNVWHSLQYLALTWMLNNLRQERGELENSSFVKRLSTDGSARRFYTFNIALTAGDVLLAGLLFSLLHFGLGLPFDYAFDRAYYVAILSFLWMHYYLDHYLFTQPQVVRAIRA